MIRTTAEASNTRLGDFKEATSTLPILKDQLFGGWFKCSSTTLLRAQGLPTVQPHQRGIRTDNRTVRKLKACVDIECFPLRLAYILS